MHIVIFLLITITLPEIKTKEIDFIPIEIIEEKEKIVKEKIVKEKKIIEKKDIIKPKPKPKKITNPVPPQKKPSKLIQNNLQKDNKIKNSQISPKIPIQKPKYIVKKNNDEVFDDMLKNLAVNEPQKENKVDFDKIVNELAKNEPNLNKKTDTKNIKKPTKETMIALERNIEKQIRKYYTIPPGLDSILLNDVTVPITINIRRDGTITRIIINKNAIKRAQSDNVYRSFLEAAERAVKKLRKFDKLPQDLYSHWDKISINFTPI